VRHILLYFLLALSLSIFAQTQPGDDDEPQTLPEPLTETALDPDEPPAGEAEPADQPAAEVDQVVADQTLEEPVESSPVESDFEPDEEISEDFPIPLPSDI
jgi:hypothetical protein